MRKLLLLCAVLFVCGWAEARHKVYCRLVEGSSPFGRKVSVSIDFGQKQGWNNSLVDEQGKTLRFNSMIDAMNYMSELGREFEQAYVVTGNRDSTVYSVTHWILSKYVEQQSEIEDGIRTRDGFRNSGGRR